MYRSKNNPSSGQRTTACRLGNAETSTVQTLQQQQKDFLNEKFNLGEVSGNKCDPAIVQKKYASRKIHNESVCSLQQSS